MDCFTHRVGVQENRRKLFLAWSASARSCRHHIVATDWKEGRKKMKHGILSLFKLTHLVLLSVKRKARGGETNFAWVSQTENEWSKVELINLGLYCLVTRFSRRLPCAAADHPLILSFRLYCLHAVTYHLLHLSFCATIYFEYLPVHLFSNLLKTPWCEDDLKKKTSHEG